MSLRLATGVLASLVLATMSLPSAAQAVDKGIGAIEVNSTEINVSGEGHRRSFPCEGRKLVVAGIRHVITTTGECSAIDISGEGNVIDVSLKPKAMLEVAGHGHTVRWRAPDNPSEDISGANHQIKRVK